MESRLSSFSLLRDPFPTEKNYRPPPPPPPPQPPFFFKPQFDRPFSQFWVLPHETTMSLKRIDLENSSPFHPPTPRALNAPMLSFSGQNGWFCVCQLLTGRTPPQKNYNRRGAISLTGPIPLRFSSVAFLQACLSFPRVGRLSELLLT